MPELAAFRLFPFFCLKVLSTETMETLADGAIAMVVKLVMEVLVDVGFTAPEFLAQATIVCELFLSFPQCIDLAAVPTGIALGTRLLPAVACEERRFCFDNGKGKSISTPISHFSWAGDIVD